MGVPLFSTNPAGFPQIVSHTVFQAFYASLVLTRLCCAISFVSCSVAAGMVRCIVDHWVSMGDLATHKGWFVDRVGRRVLLRGVNLGGSSKVPTTPPGATHLPQSLDPTEPISFIDRPFSLATASAHFARIQRWGWNAIRLVVPWEAVEHAGPGQYDTSYLAWLRELVALAGQYGLFVVIDFHQTPGAVGRAAMARHIGRIAPQGYTPKPSMPARQRLRCNGVGPTTRR
jgi:hypothetical protein